MSDEHRVTLNLTVAKAFPTGKLGEDSHYAMLSHVIILTIIFHTNVIIMIMIEYDCK